MYFTVFGSNIITIIKTFFLAVEKSSFLYHDSYREITHLTASLHDVIYHTELQRMRQYLPYFRENLWWVYCS